MWTDYIITTDCSSVHLAMELGGVGRCEVGPAEAEWALQRPARTRRPGLSCPAPASLATPAIVSIRVDIQRLSSCVYYDLKSGVKNR